MDRIFHRRIGLIIGSVIFLFMGCSVTPPSKFYTLSSLSQAVQDIPVSERNRGIIVGIGPIELPEYLNRPQIVTHISPNELQISEFNQWAEPLKDNFSRIFTQNISIILREDPIVVVPWRHSQTIKYQIEMEVISFHGIFGRQVELIARWTIMSPENGNTEMITRSKKVEPVRGQSFEALVAAQSRCVASLSRDIADAIRMILK